MSAAKENAARGALEYIEDGMIVVQAIKKTTKGKRKVRRNNGQRPK